MRTIIAVDPGASGGIAWHDGSGAKCAPMPETRGDIISLIKSIAPDPFLGSDCIVAYHEDNPDFIPTSGQGQMCAYGRGQERCACILETLGVRVVMVRPQAWQKVLALGKSDRIKATKDMNAAQRKNVTDHNAVAKRTWKNKLKSHAQRLFPGANVTLKTADALLILEYGMHQEGGGHTIVPAAPLVLELSQFSKPEPEPSPFG